MAEIMYGHCRACDQVRLVKAASQNEANYKASCQCSCKEGADFREFESLKKSIDALCGEGSLQHGYCSIEPQVVERIKEVAWLILTGKIEKATFSLEGIIIYLKQKAGHVKIKRTMFSVIDAKDIKERKER